MSLELCYIKIKLLNKVLSLLKSREIVNALIISIAHNEIFSYVVLNFSLLYYYVCMFYSINSTLMTSLVLIYNNIFTYKQTYN